MVQQSDLQSNLQTNAVAVVRLVAGFAGFGASSVSLAISSSLFTAAAAGRSPLLVPAIAAALWGTALLGWTVAALRSGSFPWPRLSSALLLTAASLHLLSLLSGGGTDLAGLNISHLAALLLTLTVVAAQGWLQRQARLQRQASVRGASGGGASGGAGAGRLLLGAFAGAVAIAAITTPGLAASTAGQFAVPHGSHLDGGHSDGGAG
ncbi:MAG: hypothetical protein K0Q84_1992, partial [Arthrobacter sp.]|nr:hypothetical protein [Arthrobacter sp.]